MSERSVLDRRDFLSSTAMGLAAAQLSAMQVADAQSGTSEYATRTAFASPKQIKAGVLNVGYAETGPENGPVVVLLHGWPYDIHCYDAVSELLAAAGYRVIVPYLRGYGTTRFLSSQTFRSGNQVVFAVDTIALMDALHIPKAIVAGFDWGGRAAVIMAALWPERCSGLVAVSGYTIINLEKNQQPLLPKAELGWWYQYYFATERGRTGYGKYRHDFNKLIWTLASPKWNFDDATFDRTAASFDNPDHVDIVIHNYRWRLKLAGGDPKYGDLENSLQELPGIAVPTITIGSDFDGQAKDGSSYRNKFSAKYEHRILDGIGHNVPQEAPRAFADAILHVSHASEEARTLTS